VLKIKLFISYIRTYWITTSLVGYMIGATILKTFSSIDITIPCLIKYTTGHSCYGCGLTTAVTHILKFDIQSAAKANALVFVVLPILFFLILNHWRKFIKENSNSTN